LIHPPVAPGIDGAFLPLAIFKPPGLDFDEIHFLEKLAFFVFELLPVRGEHETGSEWVLVYRSRPTKDAHIEVTQVLQQLWSTGA
jgi:hypothetical protein